MAWTDPRYERRKQREEQVRIAGIFGETFYDEAGETHSYAALAPAALESQPQLELELTGYSKHAMIRKQLAQKIDGAATRLYQRTGAIDCYLERLAGKLRNARHKGSLGLQLQTGRRIFFWDEKAGLSRLCPDDAREESMRLQRKVIDPLEQLQRDGHALHYAVFTTPNAERGKLREEMEHIYLRFRKLLKAKNADGELLFPEIRGALCVLEAPLGRSRDWNVHLNVILVVRGFLDYKKLRAWWHWNVELQPLATGPGVVRGALAELIKYAVAATVSKSAKKAEEAPRDRRHDRTPSPGESAAAGDPGSMADAACGRAEINRLGVRPSDVAPGVSAHIAAPPMLEWTDAELLEWIAAMRGFRRTRSYGVLYGLEKPEPEDNGPIVMLGTVNLQGGRYVCSLPLLESIPGDKFSGMTGAERWLAIVRMLDPAGLRGAGSLGETIPPLTHVTN